MPRWPGRRTRQTASARAQIAATKVCFAAPGNAVSREKKKKKERFVSVGEGREEGTHLWCDCQDRQQAPDARGEDLAGAAEHGDGEGELEDAEGELGAVHAR